MSSPDDVGSSWRPGLAEDAALIDTGGLMSTMFLRVPSPATTFKVAGGPDQMLPFALPPSLLAPEGGGALAQDLLGEAQEAVGGGSSGPLGPEGAAMDMGHMLEALPTLHAMIERRRLLDESKAQSDALMAGQRSRVRVFLCSALTAGSRKMYVQALEMLVAWCSEDEIPPGIATMISTYLTFRDLVMTGGVLCQLAVADPQAKTEGDGKREKAEPLEPTPGSGVALVPPGTKASTS